MSFSRAEGEKYQLESGNILFNLYCQNVLGGMSEKDMQIFNFFFSVFNQWINNKWEHRWWNLHTCHEWVFKQINYIFLLIAKERTNISL